MIELNQIRELVQLMKDHDLTEIELRDGDQEISLKRGGAPSAPLMATIAAPMMASPGGQPAPIPAATPTPASESGDLQDEGLVPIRSPMVGTLYTRPDPDSDPYVTQGDQVTEDTIVCIIEAMKVFNEIRAEVAGAVERILVENETAVEYGQPLMLVRPVS